MYPTDIDPAWRGHDDGDARADALAAARAKIASTPALLLDAWNDWCERHDAGLSSALLRAAAGDRQPLISALDAAILAAAVERLAAQAGERCA